MVDRSEDVNLTLQLISQFLQEFSEEGQLNFMLTKISQIGSEGQTRTKKSPTKFDPPKGKSNDNLVVVIWQNVTNSDAFNTQYGGTVFDQIYKPQKQKNYQ